ncbi:MAG: type 11 methyltransferase [Deltaproteobacteria bacterium]|nr:type 11 methyltransferase [Deltaproteobacteria bacterium]
MSAKVTRGNGLLEAFLAKKRGQLTDKLIPSSCRTGRILDIGCGSFPLFLTGIEFAGKYALDKKAVEESRELDGQGITFLNFDIEMGEKLPFDDEYFDVVTMLAVFEHIEPAKLTVILKEIHRILKKKGLYVLTTPAVWTQSLLKLMASFNLVSSAEIEEHKGAYNHRLIAELLGDAFFPPEKMRFGYFEMFMNNWAVAEK